jgi:tRNA threonylcarbamoyladenosine biosynthesis protein TsaB
LKILALDTATEACSVAVLMDGPHGTAQLVLRELPPGPGHSAHILSLVQEVLRETGLTLGQLDCIAFGRGPGGFTGVRLAASVTQGLAYGAGLKVIPVSDLLAVAQRALDLAPTAASVVVCNDARMKEVYWTCATRGAEGLAIEAALEQVGPPDSVQLPLKLAGPVHGAGRGFAVWPQLQERLGMSAERVEAGLLPCAREIARLAAPLWRRGEGLEPERAQPIYLRDDVAKPSRK